MAIFATLATMKKFFQKLQLGTLEFLCALLPIRTRVALVLYSQRVVLVLQFFQSHHHFWRV
jgi:hypothetical protein